MSLPIIIDNVLFNTIIWILLIYTVASISYEIVKRRVLKNRRLEDAGNCNSSNRKG